MWCGHRASTAEPGCSYVALPGYGNGWSQQLVFDQAIPKAVTGDISVAFNARYDSESGYDFTYFEYVDITQIAETWVTVGAYDGCALIKDFDLLQPAGDAVRGMFYDRADGTGDDATDDAAVITQRTVNAQGKTARVVLAGFSYHYIRDDRPQYRFDRLDYMDHMIRWLETLKDTSTGAGDTPLVTSLAQNYPNPFNPATTIEFAIAARV